MEATGGYETAAAVAFGEAGLQGLEGLRCALGALPQDVQLCAFGAVIRIRFFLLVSSFGGSGGTAADLVSFPSAPSVFIHGEMFRFIPVSVLE